MSCAGCQARDSEIAFLRESLRRAEDRLDRERDRATAKPTEATFPPAPEMVRETDKEGVEWVVVGGTRVRAHDFDRMTRGEGVIVDGHFSDNEEFARANAMLTAQLSGERPL